MSMNGEIHQQMGSCWYMTVTGNQDLTDEAKQHLVAMGWEWEWDPWHMQYLARAPETHIELLKLAETPLPPNGCEVGDK